MGVQKGSAQAVAGAQEIEAGVQKGWTIEQIKTRGCRRDGPRRQTEGMVEWEK